MIVVPSYYYLQLNMVLLTVYVDIGIAHKIDINAKLQLPLVNFSYLDIDVNRLNSETVQKCVLTSL